MIHLKIEGIKFKNSFSMYVLLISPLVFLCFAIFTVLFAKSNTGTANSCLLLTITSPRLPLKNWGWGGGGVF
ncbi:hypothetical protein ACVQJF_11450, partial [Staphylococcus aureus]